MKITNKSLLIAAIGACLSTAPNIVFANNPNNCSYDLESTDAGTAQVTIKGKKLTVKVQNARPHTLYTIWLDFKSRATGELSEDYPLDKGALGRGVAPAFASTAGVTAGIGIDPNGFVTNNNGRKNFRAKLDYRILDSGASPVVGGELSMQGTNRIGGYWLRQYSIDPAIAPSVQEVHPYTGLPLLERATVQGITIQYHPDYITHGHTPGVGGVDHSGAFKGDIPADCKDTPESPQEPQ